MNHLFSQICENWDDTIFFKWWRRVYNYFYILHNIIVRVLLGNNGHGYNVFTVWSVDHFGCWNVLNHTYGSTFNFLHLVVNNDVNYRNGNHHLHFKDIEHCILIVDDSVLNQLVFNQSLSVVLNHLVFLKDLIILVLCVSLNRYVVFTNHDCSEWFNLNIWCKCLVFLNIYSDNFTVCFNVEYEDSDNLCDSLDNSYLGFVYNYVDTFNFFEWNRIQNVDYWFFFRTYVKIYSLLVLNVPLFSPLLLLLSSLT